MTDKSKIFLHKIQLLALLITFCSISSLAFAEESKVIKSACEYDYPPFCLVTVDNQPRGFSVDLLKASLAVMGYDVTFAVGEWGDLKEDLRAGNLDVLPMVGRTPEREAIYDFTFHYVSLYGAIFVRKGDKRIKLESDLWGKEVLVVSGDNAEEYAIRENITDKLISVGTYKEAILLLDSGKHDAIVMQQRIGAELLRDMNISSVVSVHPHLEKFQQDFCFAVKKGNTHLLAALNEGLSIVMSNGVFDKLYRKWFARKIDWIFVLKLFLMSFVPLLIISVICFIVMLRKEIRKKTKDLQEANIVWKKTFDSAPDMIAVVDENFKIIKVNLAMCKVLNMQENDLIGKFCCEVIHGKETISDLGQKKCMLTDGEVHNQEIYEKRLGGYCEITVIPFKDKKEDIKGSLHIVRDINERKEIETNIVAEVNKRTKELNRKTEDLFQTKRKYRIVADFNYDWEYWELPDGSLSYVSPSCADITGYSAEEFVTKPDLLTVIVLPADKDLWMSYSSSRRASNDKREQIRFRIRTKDGVIRWIEHACQAVHENGEFFGFRISNRDITERQEASAERNMLREQITHMMRLNAMGELAAALAHEINQPLGAILNNAQAAMRLLSLQEPDLDEIEGALSDIVSDDKRASEIVRRLRRMVKSNVPDYEPTNFHELVEEVLSLLRSLILFHNVKISTDFLEKAPEIKCDRIQIQQVLLNLITNAVDAMKDLSKNDRILNVRMLDKGDGYLHIIVDDNGKNMTAEKIDNLFKPFYTTKKKGMGMGLAISKRIIEMHRGRLWGELNENNGMKFCFTIPHNNREGSYAKG